MERAQDEVFAMGGEVASALVAAQLEQKVDPAAGQAAYAAFSQALVSMSAARGHVVDGHKVLNKVARVFGIRVPASDVVGYGDEFKYPVAVSDETQRTAAA